MSLGDGVLVWGLGPSAAFRGFAFEWEGHRSVNLVGVKGGLVVVFRDVAGPVGLLGVDGGHLLGIASDVGLSGVDDGIWFLGLDYCVYLFGLDVGVYGLSPHTDVVPPD